MTFDLAVAARALGWRMAPDPLMVKRWSIDTRTLEPGDAFVALRGPNHDGHDHVAAAFDKGAAVALVERDMEANGPLVRVTDTLEALQELARWAREQWHGALVAITGSAGKTSTKDTVAHLLSTRLRTSKTAGNLNNHIGLPLSILQLSDEAEVAVIEIGMNHAGEIRHLAGIARPTAAVVTNVGWAHIENFDSRDGIAAAKRELVETLPPGAPAILNADDALVAAFAGAHHGPTLTFGIEHDAAFRAEALQLDAGGARFVCRGQEFDVPVPGRHTVLNVLAGVAVAHGVFAAPLADLAAAARQLRPARMRGECLQHNGISILNDCYNSNPDAARAMLAVLRDTPGQRHIAVLGEMLELGRWSGELHRDVGRYAAECGIDVLVGIRGAARHLVEDAVLAGLPAGAAYFFDTPEEAGEQLRGLARPGDAILFKGSRGTRVEKALERFMA